MKLRVATVAVVFAAIVITFSLIYSYWSIDRVRRNGDIVRQIGQNNRVESYLFVHYTPGGSPETAVPFGVRRVDKTHKQYPTEGQGSTGSLK